MGSQEFVKLTQRQEEILLGTLLGDGFLEQNGKNARLKIDHKGSQKDYVLWLHKEFKSIALKPYQIFVQDKRNDKVYNQWRFATYSLPLLNPWIKLFYRNRRKIVPLMITELITPLSLAVWYMDDGFRRTDCKGIYLCTSGYSMKEQKVLQVCLKKKFDIRTALHFAAKNVRIYIPSSQADNFCNIVRPFILPSFSYKLFDPVTTEDPHIRGTEMVKFSTN